MRTTSALEDRGDESTRYGMRGSQLAHLMGFYMFLSMARATSLNDDDECTLERNGAADSFQIDPKIDSFGYLLLLSISFLFGLE